MNCRTVAASLLAGGILVGLTTACSAPDAAAPASSSPLASSRLAAPSSPPASSGTVASSTRPHSNDTTADDPVPQTPPQTPQQTEPAAEPIVVPCDSASPGSLATIAGNSAVAGQLVTPIVFDDVQCAGTSARARTAPDGQHQPTGVLFRYSPAGQWTAVAVGSAIDCGSHGTTAEDAAKLEGCR